ncbi:MAG: Lrp/AsnC family transcriptional regulator [Epsilonproteobacteria bacterium]|nr:Lrp/AsnC family transcriptional regulator [Campylobacterota bacterium]
MTQELLATLQKNFPLTSKPFEQLANEFNIPQQQLLSLLQEQKDAGVIRQTSAIFDTKRLGYTSSLVAFKVDPSRIEEVSKIINSHPGVSHNYEREHEFNLWFTIAVAPDSKLGLDKTVQALAKMCDIEHYIILPTLKLFKIAVKLDTTGKAKKKEKVNLAKHKQIELTQLHRDVIKLLQYDIEFTKEPFKPAIEQLGIDYDTLFAVLNELKEAGYMRRFATILNHRRAGFSANAMVVWEIEDDKAQQAGATAAEFSAVSHCYLRPKYDNWPYNLFTMIHGKTQDETNAVIAEIAQTLQTDSYRPLYSSREFKKQRIEYFIPAFSEWEEQYLQGATQ